MYLAQPSFELPCWHCFQRADIAFNLTSNLIFGDFQVIARLEIHPERRTIVEVARETQGCISSNCAFLVDDIGDPRHRDAQVHSTFSNSAKSGYNKGTIRSEIRYLWYQRFPPTRCHGRGRGFESRRPRYSF